MQVSLQNSAHRGYVNYKGENYQMLKNIKIRTRMLLSYAVIIVLCLGASVAALIMMNQISGNLTTFYDNNYAATVKAWTAKQEIQYARADILNAILETDDDDMHMELDNATAAFTNMRAAFPVIAIGKV
ncbi:hypothetical protein PMF13cell1_04014 [Blautia producta]|uniref:Chemotaxis methyl-accepting receptor HlyB-like 4HB MCP domain-containing protein n=2 Tax=Blautia producta TaxID=33035 RepID=A0A4V0Z7Y8_9FIRM|nr:hypothetical protein PMF13cell1_04014 [Blautia producta]